MEKAGLCLFQSIPWLQSSGYSLPVSCFRAPNRAIHLISTSPDAAAFSGNGKPPRGRSVSHHNKMSA